MSRSMQEDENEGVDNVNVHTQTIHTNFTIIHQNQQLISSHHIINQHVHYYSIP